MPKVEHIAIKGRQPKKRLTILVDQEAIAYFVKMGKDIDMPYHTLINMYLKKCALEKQKLAKSSLINYSNNLRSS